MFGHQLYPTPLPLANRLVAPYLANRGKYTCILEPSAGKGDLADYLKRVFGDYKCSVHAIEIDPNLRSVLAGKGHTVIDSDFLKFDGDYGQYNLIVMNPPFDGGAKHLLHAWEIMRAGDIACVLNAETVRNPHTAERKLLRDIIAEHGSVEEVGQPFAAAERKATVDCVVVRLTKIAPAGFGFDGAYEHDQRVEDVDFSPNALAGKEMIASVVAQYDAARAAMVEKYAQQARLEYYLKGIKLPYAGRNDDSVLASASLNDALLKLKAGFWDYIFKRTKIGEVTTSKFQKDFQKFRDQTVTLAFSTHNIGEVIALFVLNRKSIMQNCIVQTFDKATAYHADNKVHVEGWKTNRAYKVTKKVIMPSGVKFESKSYEGHRWSSWGIDYHNYDFFDDLDKCLCFVTGKQFKNVAQLTRAIRDRIDGLNRGHCDYQDVFTSEFFRVRFFKKGTVHLEFTDDFAWAAFNQAAAEGKNWIGKDT